MLMNKGMFYNYKKPLYVANKDKEPLIDEYNNEIVTYSEPFLLGRFNYQALFGQDLYSFMSAFGETQNKLVRVFIDSKYKGMVNQFDKVYLYDANPKNEDINGENANYIVRVCTPQNTKIMLIFEEITKEEI